MQRFAVLTVVVLLSSLALAEISSTADVFTRVAQLREELPSDAKALDFLLADAELQSYLLGLSESALSELAQATLQHFPTDIEQLSLVHSFLNAPMEVRTSAKREVAAAEALLCKVDLNSSSITVNINSTACDYYLITANQSGTIRLTGNLSAATSANKTRGVAIQPGSFDVIVELAMNMNFSNATTACRDRCDNLYFIVNVVQTIPGQSYPFKPCDPAHPVRYRFDPAFPLAPAIGTWDFASLTYGLTLFQNPVAAPFSGNSDNCSFIIENADNIYIPGIYASKTARVEIINSTLTVEDLYLIPAIDLYVGFITGTSYWVALENTQVSVINSTIDARAPGGIGVAINAIYSGVPVEISDRIWADSIVLIDSHIYGDGSIIINDGALLCSSVVMLVAVIALALFF